MYNEPIMDRRQKAAMQRKKQCLTLFLAFLKIGAFTFGGGYAMVPLIHREAVETHQWATDDDILDLLAIAESTPGVIAINAATFIGYRVAGFWGSLWATAGVTLPSFSIIAILSFFIMQYHQIQWLAWVFEGIRAGVIVLILNAVLKLKKACPKNLFTKILMLCAFIGAAFLDIDIILILVFAAAAGILRFLALSRRSRNGEGDKND